MENIYNDGFAILKHCTKMEEAFSSIKNIQSDQYSMVWVTDGMVDLLVDDILVPLNKNQMTFITPVNYVKVLENHGSVNILQFNRAFYCIRENDHEVSCNGILYFGTQGVPIIDLSEKEVASFDRLFYILKEEFEIRDTIQGEMLRVILKKWLIKSTRILKTQNHFVATDQNKTELLRQFRILIEKNFKTHHKVHEYASMLNKSPKTMSNQFRMLGQSTPSFMIQDRIMLEAKRYLLFSALSIKEIAHNLGFEDGTSFVHFFKRLANKTPSQFRKASA